jgi:CRP-like cAMP-binding protein
MPNTTSRREYGAAAPAAKDALHARELALRSRPVLDLAPRTARLIALAGSVGVVLVVVGSLVGDRPATVAIDKLIHLAGYAVLAAIFVLALRPRWYLSVLLGLAALSYLIEVVQPLNLRNFDLGDALANSIGLAVGAAAGLVIRLAYGYLKTELATVCLHRKLIAVEPGTTIVHEGDSIDTFFIVRRGIVALYREVDGVQAPVAHVGPGEMFGLLAEILRMPQYATAVAATAAQVYRIDYDDIIADAGGAEQPAGVVLRGLAADLHQAWDTIAELHQGDRERLIPARRRRGSDINNPTQRSVGR